MRPMINPDDQRAAEVQTHLEKLLRGLKENPSQAPRSYAALARQIGVDTATLWRHRTASLQVARLAEQIIRAGQAGRLPKASASPEKTVPPPSVPDDASFIPNEEIQIRSAQVLRKARWAMQRFVSKERRQKHLSDLPRAVYDLEKSIAEANGALKELRLLSDIWLLQQRGQAEQEQDSQRDLPLDL